MPSWAFNVAMGLLDRGPRSLQRLAWHMRVRRYYALLQAQKLHNPGSKWGDEW